MAFNVTEGLNAKFDSRYEIISETGCWIWTGALTHHRTHRYGNLPNGKCNNIKAHRYSAARFLGVDLSSSDFVCHKCDVTECVNPNHLYVGSAADNCRDRDRRGKHVSFKGEEHPMRKLSESAALEIFNSKGSHRLIASAFGVSKSTVTAIKNGRLWAHLTGCKN